MAQKTRAQLQAENAALFVENTTGDITPTLEKAYNEDVNDSFDELPVEITYADLTALIGASGLTRLSKYLITDADPGDMLVTANAPDSLYENAQNVSTGQPGRFIFSANWFIPTNNIYIQAPTVNDDVAKEYGEGSVWIDGPSNTQYICLENTEGAAVWRAQSGNWTPTFTGFTTASDIVSSFMDLGSRVAFNLQFDANIAEPLNGQITVPDFLPMATGANIVCQGVWVNRYNSDAGVINAYVDSDGSGKIQLNIISIENPTDCEFSIAGSYKKA